MELAEVQRKVQDVSLREGRQKGVGADTFVVAVSFELGYWVGLKSGRVI